ncbi:sensor histidine kinase [Tenacibaculum caenipelagi]|uniref:GHKL domain-containing protein n=1 Tax=Tenacibaculum caenipelagi TaxID=1325435 RepID=A0A4R6TGH6_9FLAO|nr:histidine kinase [Tenacibaculum caenipelagi]TDQ27846.1 GHKL domain-containing protein [Tenacibaculum caenipelagi]
MNKNNKITLFAHVLIWLVLISMPYILSYGQEQNINRIIAHFWVPMLFYAIIFYINYFFLIDRFLFQKNTLLFVLINTLMIATFIALKEQIESYFFLNLIKKPTDNNGKAPPLKMIIYAQMLSYLAPLLFSIAIKTTKRWVKAEAERKEAANFKLQSELQHLHYQLQPHFFFNSLNNIYALVDVLPNQAKTSIHSLGKLMRYMLYETNVELVELSKEIDFLEKYIELMKLRVSDNITINYYFPSEKTNIKIAPLLFISLIENAFKHGVSANKKSEITMKMSLDAKTVIFKIENDNFPKKMNDKSGSGIGLQNLEKRLQLLYPNQYTFETILKNNRFSVFLKIETT